jgi:dissimilatory sulfite reductase (desulfoviridin) alpha/beta subunit
MLAAGGGQRGFDSVPSHENRGEGAEKILAHGVEEAKVLGEQVVDRLKNVLQEIGLHWGQLLRRRASISACSGHTEIL